MRVPIHREVHYPLWQFDEEGRPLGSLPRLIEASEGAGMGALALDALMTNPAAVHLAPQAHGVHHAPLRGVDADLFSGVQTDPLASQPEGAGGEDVDTGG